MPTVKAWLQQFARVDEARAAARVSWSQIFPQVGLDPSFERQRTSGNLPTPIPIPIPSANVDTFSVPFNMSYEVDLWGRIRRSIEAARAEAQASVADYQNVLLTLTADIAHNYFLLRALDAELVTLRRTIELRSQSVDILNARNLAGSTPEVDVDRGRTQLASARADLADLARQRAETLNAIALLCGKPVSTFEIAELPLAASPPVIPPGLPSTLLERRPDIARAERTLAAKSTQIGVAKAAYFPALSLTGQAGYLSNTASALFSGASTVWSIEPDLTLPLFNAGRTSAQVRQAEATYREFLAEYRQTVLTAFKEVEDSLAQATFLGEQAAARTEALASSRRMTKLARVRYEAGETSYLDVVDAERTEARTGERPGAGRGEAFCHRRSLDQGPRRRVGVKTIKEDDSMKENRPSTTAQRAATRRAVHQLLDDPKVFEDPFALRIMGNEGEAALRADPRQSETSPLSSYLRCIRCRPQPSRGRRARLSRSPGRGPVCHCGRGA